MLKRLISAVFVLSLILALSGTATSDVIRGKLNPVIKIDENAQFYTHIADARPDQPTFKKPEDALMQLPGNPSAPTPPQTYFCDVQDYTSGNPYYYWTIPDAYGDDLFNMRFTTEAGYDCTLMVAHYLMYGDAMVGTPDMRCYLWDDDGFGFPNAKLDSVDIPNAALPTSGLAYVSADFTPTGNASGQYWIFSDGEEYHYGWTILQNDPGDVLAIISDAADGPYVGEERASENWSGIWGSMLNDWGVDVSFFILSERCCGEIPFSDCYYQYYYTNVAYYWRAPHPVYGVDLYTQRYSVSGPETLQFVDLAIYDPADGTFGNDDVIITVYDDNAGLPGTQLAQVTIPAGTYAAFPAWTTADFSSFNLVMTNDFYVSFSSNGTPGVDYESCLSSDGTDGVGRSFCYYSGGWWDMLSLWGLDVNFLFDAYMCIDPYKDCYWNWCYTGLAYFWRLPDAWGDVAQAQKFMAVGEECRVQEVSWYLYDNGTPTAYTTNSKVSVYSDAGGYPGTELASITLTPADYVLYPAPMTVDFTPMNVYVQGDYWVAIESFGTDSTDGIRTLSDAGGGGCDDSWAEYWGIWAYMADDWGLPTRDWAAVAEAYTCCIPYSGRECDPTGEDWATYQHDYGRTGASMNPVGDAWCDMTLNWAYEDPTQGVGFCGPIIAFNKVVQSFTDHYVVFDLQTGAQLYTLSGTPEIGNYVRSTPTVAVVGTDTLLFTSGGDWNSVSAWNFNTGALVWSRDVGTYPGELYGLTRWGRFTVLNIGGTDYVFWGTDDGYVVGADAATGVKMAGYPVSLSLSTFVSGATDGTNLFYATFGSGVEGDIYSIDAATGTINWQLSSAGGLQGVNVWTHANGYFGDEGFTAGVAYSDGKLYANSRAEADYPTDGLVYSINAADGSVNFATLGNRAYYSTPIVDITHIYIPTLTRWVSPPAGANLIGVNKSSGAIERTFTGQSGGRYYVDGVLSCEPEPEPDYLYVFDEMGFLSCINSVDFSEVYRRRIERPYGYAANIGMAGALAPDEGGNTHVVFATYWGDIFDMTKGADRPRLEIQTYNPTAAVEFGSATSYPVVFEDVFVNTGCTDLNFITVTADENDPGQTIPDFASANTVDEDFMMKANQIADELAREAYLSKFLRPNDNILDENSILTIRENELNKERINRAAAGFPPYLNAVDWPYNGAVLAAGDTADLELDVIQANINRGPQCFYITFETNDPDFFLNNPTQAPAIRVCLVGGCLIDTTTLNFGVGAANTQLVTNTGRLGTGDWDPHGFEIDGDNSSYYQGAYVYATSTYRIAVHTQDWVSGGGEAEAFVSMQPDPNWCDNDCKPHLMSGITLGEMTNDGGNTYFNVTGDMVCKSFIDSVQNFDLGYGWDWENFGAPFDNDSTMGLYCNGRVVGAVDVPELANVTLEILEFSERNGNPVTGWYLGEMYDCDNGNDTVAIDRSISAAWSYNQPAADQAWGQIKIPFGCCAPTGDFDLEPIINTWGLYGASGTPGFGFWGWGIFWDSCYTYMTAGTGEFGYDMSNGDGEALVTLAAHDFDANGTYSVGIAHFALHGMTDASSSAEIAPLARLVNQWAGFGRGDVNNDGAINLVDIIYLAGTVNGGPGAVPFKHLSDVNADGLIDMADVNYLIDYYFNGGPCPMGDWIF